MKKGFSLIELLVVIAIIGVLATIGVVSFSVVAQKSRNSRRLADIVQIRSALEMYRSDNSGYPTSGLSDLSEYMGGKVPVGPKGDVYEYSSIDGSTYTLKCDLESTEDDSECEFKNP